MNALVPISPQPEYAVSDLTRMARAVASSGLFGIKTEDQALALMLVAQAEGLHPASAARDYDIIQGRPAKKSEAMLRDFIRSGGTVKWHGLDDTTADATFSHPQGGEVRISWDMDRAKLAGLGAKDMWKKFPRQMLRSRTVSEGIRTVCPMATGGMYVPEEVEDFDAPRNVSPRRAVAETATVIETDEPLASAEELAISHLKSCAIDRAIFKEAWEKNKDGWKGVMDGPSYSRVVKVMKDLAASLPEEGATTPQAADDFGLSGDDVPSF